MNGRSVAIGLLVVTAWGCAIQSVCAQDEPAQPPVETKVLRLFERPPFDRLTLQESAGGGTFDVRTLDLPDRRVPNAPAPNSRLKVHLLERDVEADIYWRDIERVELFEEMVLAEAEALVAQKKFDAAYDYYNYLHTLYPNTKGLMDSTQHYWYRNAGALFQEGRFVQALALLDQVHQQNADYEGLAAAISRVADRLMSEYLRDKNYPAARRLLESTIRRSGAGDPTASKWRETLMQAADTRLQTAMEEFSAKHYREAREAALVALDIWPRVAGADELLSRINAAYPMIIVSVPQGEAIHAVSPALHPALYRRRQLTHRPLARLSGYTASGPRYDSTWGEINLASDRRHVQIELRREEEPNAQLTGYDVAELLQAGAKNGRRSVSLVNAVEVSEVYSVKIHFAEGYVSPLAWLARLPLAGEAMGDYVTATDEAEVRMVTHAGRALPSSPQEIIERQSRDPASELSELLRGKIDVIARVDPAQVEQLREEQSVVVQPYALPRVHVLIPNAARPYPANRTFRRAVAYAIHRKHILQNELLGGGEQAGCQVSSGVCPTSDNADDFWAYGYDKSITPLPYEPALAVTLLRVAQDEIAQSADRQDRDAPVLEKIVIGHEDDWLHAKAAKSIVESLNRLGLPAARLEIRDGKDHAKCDFIYAELLSREPVLDIAELVSSPHLPESGILSLQVRQLASVTNWRQATDRLHEVHATLHAEQTIIPLWQIQAHCAVAKRVTGFVSEPISLYQDVHAWRISAGQTAAAPAEE